MKTLLLSLLLPAVLQAQPFRTESPYHFDGDISREVLERYLDRAVTAGYFLLEGPVGYSQEETIRKIWETRLEYRDLKRWSSPDRACSTGAPGRGWPGPRNPAGWIGYRNPADGSS